MYPAGCFRSEIQFRSKGKMQEQGILIGFESCKLLHQIRASFWKCRQFTGAWEEFSGKRKSFAFLTLRAYRIPRFRSISSHQNHRERPCPESSFQIGLPVRPGLCRFHLCSWLSRKRHHAARRYEKRFQIRHSPAAVHPSECRDAAHIQKDRNYLCEIARAGVPTIQCFRFFQSRLFFGQAGIQAEGGLQPKLLQGGNDPLILLRTVITVECKNRISHAFLPVHQKLKRIPSAPSQPSSLAVRTVQAAFCL